MTDKTKKNENKQGIEFYRMYRPDAFADVEGQAEAMKSLAAMGRAGNFPHVLLLSGPSGCGKTTLARILKKMLKCSDFDFHEVNAAGEAKGVDFVRDIKSRVGVAAIGGSTRIWLIDECHNLTPAAQEAFLKLLEDTPKHVYFMLATTDPGKLKKTIITRSAQVKLGSLKDADIRKVVQRVLDKLDKQLEDTVYSQLIHASDGSARKALVLLQQIIDLPEIDDQLRVLEQGAEGSASAKAFDLAKKLVYSPDRTSWSTIQKLLKELDDDPEAVRWVVMGCAKKVLLDGGDMEHAARVIEEFRDNFFDTKVNGLVLACYRLWH